MYAIAYANMEQVQPENSNLFANFANVIAKEQLYIPGELKSQTFRSRGIRK